MNDKSKLFFAFALGALVGVAIVKLLDSEKGKEFVDNVKDKASSAAEDIKEKISKLESELAELIDNSKENDKNKTI